MDEALRAARRRDPVQEAIIENRMGGGIGGWLKEIPATTDTFPPDEVSLRAVLGAVIPVARGDPTEGVTHWGRVVQGRGFIVVRFERIVVITAGKPPTFPATSYLPDWTPWIEVTIVRHPTEIAASDVGLPIRVCRTRGSVKDVHARAAYDRSVGKVHGWLASLQRGEAMAARMRASSAAAPPGESTEPRSGVETSHAPVVTVTTSFTMSQARVFTGLDPLGE